MTATAVEENAFDNNEAQEPKYDEDGNMIPSGDFGDLSLESSSHEATLYDDSDSDFDS